MEGSNDLCEICFTNPVNTTLSCKHIFCSSCLKMYLFTKINDGEVFDLNCPRCNASLKNEEIKLLTSDELFHKYEMFLSVKELLKNPYTRLCPQPDCKGFDNASPSKKKLTCRMCAYKYCYGCSNPWHNGKCKISIDSKFSSWAKKEKVKLCPRCRSYVFRNGGCSHMTCSKCSTYWCWICGSELDGKHSQISCLIGKKISDCYWTSILIFLLFPISFFFLFFFGVWYMIEINDVPCQCFVRYKFFVRSLAFILSPVMSLILLPLLMAVFFLRYLLKETCCRDLKYVIGKSCLLVFSIILFILVYPTSFAIYVALGIVFSVFLPVLGFFLLLFKIVNIFKNLLSKDD